MRFRLARPDLLVDIGRDRRPLLHPRGRRRRGDRRAHASPRRREQRAAADRCARSWRTRPAQIGDPQVRHMGTIGGSVAHADPASDLPTVLVALGADLVDPRRRAARSRTVNARDFFKGLFTARPGAERGADRDPRARRRRGGLELPEVPSARAGLGARGRGRGASNGGAPRGAHEHGGDAAARGRRRGGARRRRRSRDRGGHGRTRAPRLRPTRSAAPSTAGSSRRCSCAARSRRRWARVDRPTKGS